MRGLIYKVTNNINNRVYVGQTTKTIEERWSGHLRAARNNSQLLLHKAIRKYGESAFTIELLEICNNIERLNELEVYYIGAFNALSKGYNLTSGGCGIRGYSHTESTKKKIGDALRDTRLSKEAIDKMKKAKLIQWQDQSYRNKQVTAAVNRWAELDERKQQSKKRGGRRIRILNLLGEACWEGIGIRLAAQQMNLDHTSIWRCLHGKQETTKGYKVIYDSADAIEGSSDCTSCEG